MNKFDFKISATDGNARRGQVATAHGTFETPCFMATATAATVKAMHPDSVRATGAEMVICNTYHLMLRPTPERVAKLGGLHKFMNWPGPIITDSGGFQVMSLASLREITEQVVTFRSHIDGSKHELSPERSMEIQHLLDSNITMCFDECTPHPATHEQAAQSMRMSMRWAERCRKAFVKRDGYALFGINQGSVYPDLREESAAALKNIGFDGYAVGGLAVGEGQDTMFKILDVAVPPLPQDKPRYLMGVGKPDDIVGAVRRGIDMFDCVMPTRSGRTGQGFTRRVRDSEGSLGWVHKSALTSKRSAIVAGPRNLLKENSNNAEVVAHLENGSIGQILSCGKDWCRLKFDSVKGYLRKSEFWGAYPNETFN